MLGRLKAARILTAIAFLGVLAALGCGTYSPVAPSQEQSVLPSTEDPQFVRLLPTSKGAPEPNPSSAIAQMISAANGGLISNGYYTLYFPPGALDEDTEITLDMPDFPVAVIKLEPHGIVFNKAVTLSLPMEAIESDASSFRVLWHNEITGYWENIGGHIENGSIKANLEHFSRYGIDPNG